MNLDTLFAKLLRQKRGPPEPSSGRDGDVCFCVSRLGGSSSVRGQQLATRFGQALLVGLDKPIRLPPTAIFVKQVPPKWALEQNCKVLIDVIDLDNPSFATVLRKISGLIFLTSTARQYMIEKYKIPQYLHDKCILIPHHHCNFDNELVAERQPKTVGYLGLPNGLQVDIGALEDGLRKSGLNFIRGSPRTREEAVELCRKCDLQISFRREVGGNTPTPMRSPLKMINALSFGIPFIAYPEPALREIDPQNKYYEAATDLRELVDKCEMLARDSELYVSLREKGIAFARKYHADAIWERYYVPLITLSELTRTKVGG